MAVAVQDKRPSARISARMKKPNARSRVELVDNPAIEPDAIRRSSSRKRNPIINRRRGERIDAAEAKGSNDYGRAEAKDLVYDARQMSESQIGALYGFGEPSRLNNAPPRRIGARPGPFSNLYLNDYRKFIKAYDKKRKSRKSPVIEPITDTHENNGGLNQRQSRVYDLSAAESKQNNGDITIKQEPEPTRRRTANVSDEILGIQEELDRLEAEEYAKVVRSGKYKSNRSKRIRYTPGRTEFTTDSHKRLLARLKELKVRSRRTYQKRR